jgi:transposase
MNEVVETIYQWHTGMKIHHISLSLGLDRKTVRKYLGMARSLGITREGPLPEEQELVMRLKNVREHLSYERPAFDLLTAYRGQIETWPLTLLN